MHHLISEYLYQNKKVVFSFNGCEMFSILCIYKKLQKEFIYMYELNKNIIIYFSGLKNKGIFSDNWIYCKLQYFWINQMFVTDMTNVPDGSCDIVLILTKRNNSLIMKAGVMVLVDYTFGK